MADRESLYNPTPSVAPTDRATPSININIPNVRFSDAIGRALGDLGDGYKALGHYQGQVGSALASLGGSFEKAGDEIFARASAIKTIENRTAAVEADTKFKIEADKIQDAFEATNGNAASGGLEAHMKSLEDLRQKIKGTLTNPQSTHMYEQDSLEALGRFVMKAGKHGATQSKASMIAAENARYKLALNEAYKDPDNPDNEKKIERALATYEANIAPLIGESGPTLELKKKEMRSEFDKQVMGGIAKADPYRAQEMLDKRRKDMMVADIEMVEKAIENSHMNNAPRIITNEVTGDLTQKKTDEEREKEPTLRERLRKADTIVDGYKGVRNKEELRHRVHQAVTNAFTGEHNNRRDEHTRQMTILETALNGTRVQGVPAPTNMGMLKAQGAEVSAAIEATGKQGRDMADRAFSANLRRGKVVYDKIESHERFEILRAMADSDREQFMDLTVDVNDPKLKLNDREKDQLVTLKAAVRKNPNGDPQADKYHKWLREGFGAELQALGVFYRRENNMEEYDAFKAGMIATMDAFVERNKHAPSREEFLKEMKPFLLQYKPSTGFLFWGESEQRPAWSPQTAIPEKWAEWWQAGVIARGGQKLTDSELRNDFVKYMYNQSLRPKAGPEPTPQRQRRGGRAIVAPTE